VRTHTGAILGFDARPNSVKDLWAHSLQWLGVDVTDIYRIRLEHQAGPR
jgi:hypothetical protein